tara:strand:- start:282 stop:1079 length:798 start_codon:yes stop_codon:yes gene_type:complete
MNYTIKQYPDKKFTDKMDQTRFIKKHFEELKEIKKAEYKTNSQPIISGLKTKMFEPQIEDITSDFIEVKSVINTTNIIDSHLDLHMPNIWNKTVKDNPYSHHLKQHENKFESVISKKAKSYNENSNFNQLGLDVDFKTVANINQFVLERSKIPFMFDAYKNGDVDQHSVGMLYVDLDIAYYDEDSQKQMDFFNEMKEKCVNPEVADEYGYFWVIYEAKKREGSAVVFGSNSVTPTLWVKNYEPQNSTQKEAARALQARKNYLLNL